MKTPVLLIPVENQVRELDAKLLLACVAAKRDLGSIIGPKRKIENHIASFPRGIFLSKSLRIVKRKFFPRHNIQNQRLIQNYESQPISKCRSLDLDNEIKGPQLPAMLFDSLRRLIP